MATATADVLVDRALTAKKIAQAAQRKAGKVSTDQAINRSTRQRSALKVKADALDRIGEVLAGKG